MINLALFVCYLSLGLILYTLPVSVVMKYFVPMALCFMALVGVLIWCGVLPF